MKKKKIELKNLAVKSFVTDEQQLNKRTVKGGGFLSIWGDSCQWGNCPTDGGCTITCANTCSCVSNCNCPTDPPCNSTDPIDTGCVCQ